MNTEKQVVQDELLIADENNQIILSLMNDKCAKDANQIELSYREDDEHGWGAGIGEYISTVDVKAMADCIRSVVFNKQSKAHYSCQGDILKIELEHDLKSDTFRFTVSLIETLLREYHISVTKANLTRVSLEDYIQPFFIWERQHPIVD